MTYIFTCISHPTSITRNSFNYIWFINGTTSSFASNLFLVTPCRANIAQALVTKALKCSPRPLYSALLFPFNRDSRVHFHMAVNMKSSSPMVMFVNRSHYNCASGAQYFLRANESQRTREKRVDRENLWNRTITMLPHRCLRIKSQPTIKTGKKEIKPTEKNRARKSTEWKVNIIKLVEKKNKQQSLKINNEAWRKNNKKFLQS